MLALFVLNAEIRAGESKLAKRCFHAPLAANILVHTGSNANLSHHECAWHACILPRTCLPVTHSRKLPQTECAPVRAEDEVAVYKPAGHHETHSLKQSIDQWQPVDGVNEAGCSPDGHERGQPNGNHCRLLLCAFHFACTAACVLERIAKTGFAGHAGHANMCTSLC